MTLKKRPFFSFIPHPFVLIFVLCLIGYGVSLQQAFMLDDYIVLFNESGVTNKSFLELFGNYQHLFSRPVGHVMLWLSSGVFKTNPVGYHCFNLLLFTLVCFLFYKIIEKLFHNKELAFLSTAIYSLHPINSMLVNYVTATVITTFVLCLQASFLFLIKHLESGKKGAYWGSLTFFLLALFSHEMSVVYPAYVFCLLYFLRGFDWRKALVFVSPYLAMSALYVFYRMFFFTLKGQASVVLSMLGAFDAYLSSVMALIYWYVGKLIFPQDPLMLWTVVIEEQYNPWERYRLLLLAALIIYLIFFRWKKGLKAFALSIFIVGLLPVFVASYAHFPFAEPMIEPHWFYFSSIGFFIFAAQGFLLIKEKLSYLAFAVVVGLWLGMSNFLLQASHLTWRTQESYCRHWIEKNPYNMTPFYGMGQVMLSRGNGAAAVNYFEKGLKISQAHASYVIADIGYAYFLKGDNDKALVQYAAALDQEPGYSVTYYYLALLKWQQGDKVAAETFLLKAQQLYAKSNVYSRALMSLRQGDSPAFIYPLLHLNGEET